MSTYIYNFTVYYDGFEDKLWREFEVTSNYTVAKLGYLVLASVQMNEYRRFRIVTENEDVFEIEGDYGYIDEIGMLLAVDPLKVKLSSLKLQPGDILGLLYDFDYKHTFTIRLNEIKEYDASQKSKYPLIVDGYGSGIIENMTPEEYGDVIKYIDENNESDVLYHSMFSLSENWDYRVFNLDFLNSNLKHLITLCSYAYE